MKFKLKKEKQETRKGFAIGLSAEQYTVMRAHHPNKINNLYNY